MTFLAPLFYVAAIGNKSRLPKITWKTESIPIL